MRIEDAVIIRIEELCEERGITVNALSYAAGMPRSTLKNIIYGKSKNPGIGTIQMICDALEISLGEFFDAENFRALSPFND